MNLDKNTSPFAELGLPAPLLKALDSVGYETPSPIQAASIPPLMEGRDLIGQAQTGTGKTAAFALPILARIDTGADRPQALVLTPTRELAIQVAEALQSYARYMDNFHVLPIYGGQDMRGQLRQLKRGVQVVVGTPGRLLDHLRRKSLDLSDLKALVLDEADEMLRMGFIDDVETILSHTSGDQQTALFSATLPGPIRQVANRFLEDPEHIHIKTQTATVDTIEQKYWMVNHRQKLETLTRLLEVEEFDAAIIFVRTRDTSTQLAEKISARGYGCSAINGDMSQAQREKTIRQLKDSKIDILVATDVAARGLDVERISHVINYDIPYDSEAYIHRIGRTGRAGRKGNAILFITPREQRLLKTIEKATRQKIKQFAMPSHQEVAAQRVQRFKQTIVDALPNTPPGYFESLVLDLCNETGEAPETLAATLVYLLQQDRPLNPPSDASKRGKKKKENRSDPRQQPDAPSRERQPRRNKLSPEVPLERFRLEVGSNHEVTAGDIVGAIANEAGIDSQYFGRIEISDDHSTVELPTGMPKDVFKHLKKVWVRNQKLNISRMDAKPTEPGKPRRAPKRGDRKEKPRRRKG